MVRQQQPEPGCAHRRPMLAPSKLAELVTQAYEHAQKLSRSVFQALSATATGACHFSRLQQVVTRVLCSNTLRPDALLFSLYPPSRHTAHTTLAGVQLIKDSQTA